MFAYIALQPLTFRSFKRNKLSSRTIWILYLTDGIVNPSTIPSVKYNIQIVQRGPTKLTMEEYFCRCNFIFLFWQRIVFREESLFLLNVELLAYHAGDRGSNPERRICFFVVFLLLLFFFCFFFFFFFFFLFFFKFRVKAKTNSFSSEKARYGRPA